MHDVLQHLDSLDCSPALSVALSAVGALTQNPVPNWTKHQADANTLYTALKELPVKWARELFDIINREAIEECKAAIQGPGHIH